MGRGGTGPQGDTSLGNVSAGCSPNSPRLPPHPRFPSRASWDWELPIWSRVDQVCIKNKSLVPWDSDCMEFMSKEVAGRPRPHGGRSPVYLGIV